MNGEPTQRELYDAILALHNAMTRSFTTLESRLHELDEDFETFRIKHSSHAGY
jgi:hypothetical protein